MDFGYKWVNLNAQCTNSGRIGPLLLLSRHNHIITAQHVDVMNIIGLAQSHRSHRLHDNIILPHKTAAAQKRSRCRARTELFGSGTYPISLLVFAVLVPLHLVLLIVATSDRRIVLQVYASNFD